MHDTADYPVSVKLQVAWSDMDAFGHVNNVRYYRYFENARFRFYELTGLLDMKEKTGTGPIIAATSCSYLASLSYPDTLHVGARISSIGETSFVMQYLVTSEKVGAAATGEAVIVMFDYRTSGKIKIPLDVREAIQKYQ